MLVKVEYPEVLGTTAPPANKAELRTRGWEVSVKWNDRIGNDFSYDLGFILSDSQAEITKYENPSGTLSDYYVGQKIGEIWGYETEGFYQSDTDVQNHADQSKLGANWAPGDIMYKDLDGNKKINNGSNTLDDHGDLKVIGNTTPRYQYGITANMSYKNVYLNVFFQGIGKRDFWPSSQPFWPVATQYYNTQKWFVTDSWSEDNRDAYFARPIARETKNQQKQTKYLQDASYVEEVERVDSSEILYDLNGFTNQSSLNKSVVPSALKESVYWNSFPESFESYLRSFDIVQRNIFAGNSFLTNLTCCTPIETNLSLKDIFLRSKAMYKLWVRDQFTVFSPEIFIRIQQGKICSYPMKGTLDASLPSAVRQLMDDPKEAAEHATIVDLIRNDLSIVADRVSVSRYRYIDELQTNRGTILQTSSEIQGILPDNYLENLGNIIFRLLPAGSITGAPKTKTMQIISEAETYERGFYTGVMGYFDGNNLDSAVMIRFVEQEGDRMYFKSGGGITCRSEAQSEYHEMKQKIYVPIY